MKTSLQSWIGGRTVGALVAALVLSCPAVAQTPTTRLVPATAAQPAVAQPTTPAPAPATTTTAPVVAGQPVVAAAPPLFSPQELERLKATYNSLTPAEQAEMVAVYQDMGIDLAVVLGLKQATVTAPNMPPKTLLDAVRALDFQRKPEAVLAARSQLGFGSSLVPDKENGEALAKWLHTNLLAGEWKVLPDLFARITPDEATGIYSHILRSTNEGSQTLLPEEVLALGEACPGEMVDWQLDVLSQMLKNSASRYGKGQFMERIKAGTRFFGAKDTATRSRTVRLLVGAGLALEAYEFLPALEEARKNGEARVIYAHARYHEDLGASGRAGPEGEDHLKQGWMLLCEVSLLPNAEVPLRKEAMKRAIDLLPSMPPAPATEWLTKVFANEALGPAALEVVALQAMSFRDKKIDAAKRAQGIATMKSAVDTLLGQPNLNTETLRIPLRMLTTAMADEVDAAVKEKGEIRGVARETELLYRASPDERWLAAIEPSVAIRGYRSCLSIATIADETDAALDVLANAIKRFPDQGVVFADEFLQLWEKRLSPKARPGEENEYQYFYYFQQRTPSAPLTRGRQHRNLARLERLLKIMDEMGVKGRQLPSVTAAFKACHAKTEVFDREEIVSVFGSVDQLPAATSAGLAESMRIGLGGDWRNRQTQRNYGMMRSQAEISDMVEEGYELAIELSGRAVTLEPQSWRHAVLKAAISYDRVQFKQAQKKEDYAKYNEYRRQSFAAFEQASMQYADLVARGEERDNSGVYLPWFSAVLDAGQSTPTAIEETNAEEVVNNDQIERIAKALKALPDDAYRRHVGVFARDVVDSLGGALPERKPAIVRAAVKIVGDHPAGAPLRRLHELYQDLLANEIRLRLTVDGTDKVSAGHLFGASLTLRYTNSVDRETGGFDKYLYQDAYVRIGNQYRMMNYQGQIKKGIEQALGQGFIIESMGFFEPLTPSRSVKEDGQSGWQEKPLAYLVLKAKDPSIDRIPPVSFDMHFDDTSGPVTLPIVSNSPPIDAAGTAGSVRPLKNLQVQQVVDARRLVAQTDDKAVTLEIRAKADGVIPDVTDLLTGLAEALPGYAFAPDSIEVRPFSVIQVEESRPRWFYSQNTDEKKTYPTADENGIFRLSTERSWLVTYKPTAAAVGKQFTLPTLAQGVDGKLESRQYADMDIVLVQGTSLDINPRWSLGTRIGVTIGLLLVLGAMGLWYLRKRKPEGVAQLGFALPARITPLSTIAVLQRIERRAGTLNDSQRESLASDIAGIERAYFGPDGVSPQPDTAAMRAMLERWAVTVHN